MLSHSRIRFCWCLILFAGISCTSSIDSKDGQATSINFESITIKDSDYFLIEELIPLETNSSNLMGNDVRIHMGRKGFYVMDESMKDGIHLFDSAGVYLGAIASVGESPTHLKDLDDFQILNDDKVEILSAIGDHSTIYELDSNEHKLKFTVTYSASSFRKLPNGTYLFYGSYNLPMTTHRLVLTDSMGVLLDSFLINDYKNQMLPMTERNFFESKGSLYLIESFNNKVFRFEESVIKEDLAFDFGNYGIPERFWEMDIMEGFAMLQENKFANLDGVFRNDHLMAVSVHLQGNDGVSKRIVFSNRKNNKSIALESNLNGDNLFHYPFWLDNNHFWFFTYRSTIIEKGMKRLKGNLIQLIPEKEFDYPVLLKVKIPILD